MDLFERLKAAKAAKEAAAKAEAEAKNAAMTLAPRPVLPIRKPAPAASAPSFNLRKPSVAPVPATNPTPLESAEVASEHEFEFDGMKFNMNDLDFSEVADDDDDEEAGEDAAADHEAITVPEPSSERPETVAPAMAQPALRRPVQTHAIRRTAPPQTTQQSQPVVPATAPPEAPADNAQGKSILASLQARAAAQNKPVVYPGSTTEAKQLASDISDFDIEEMLNGWPEDDGSADINVARAEMLRAASRKLQTMFDQELAENTVIKASDIAIAEIAKIAKLCFIRVKSSPSAYALLDQKDRHAMVKALLLSAARRNATAKSRKPKEAASLSASMEVLTSENPALAELADKFNLDF